MIAASQNIRLCSAVAGPAATKFAVPIGGYRLPTAWAPVASRDENLRAGSQEAARGKGRSRAAPAGCETTIRVPALPTMLATRVGARWPACPPWASPRRSAAGAGWARAAFFRPLRCGWWPSKADFRLCWGEADRPVYADGGIGRIGHDHQRAGGAAGCFGSPPRVLAARPRAGGQRQGRHPNWGRTGIAGNFLFTPAGQPASGILGRLLRFRLRCRVVGG
jgi:hypothetical protein